MQEISVKEDCMTVTISHQQPKSESRQNGAHSSKFGVGVRVLLEGLGHTPVQHKDESWTNPSLLNGSSGVIVGREDGLWLVALESNNLVIRAYCQLYSTITQNSERKRLIFLFRAIITWTQ